MPCCGYREHVRDRDPTGSLELPHEESYGGWVFGQSLLSAAGSLFKDNTAIHSYLH